MAAVSVLNMQNGVYRRRRVVNRVMLTISLGTLVFGLFWKRATTQGAILAVAMGLGVWLLFVASPMLSEAFPQQLAGVLAALVGMIGGSLAPQWIDDHNGHVTHYEGSAS